MNNNSILLSFACIIIISIGLSLASAVVVPFLLAVFISIALSPILDLFFRVHVRRIFAVLILVFIFFEILWFLGNIIFDTLDKLSLDLPLYQAKFATILENFTSWLNKHGIKVSSFVMDNIELDKIFTITSSILKQTSNIITKTFLVLLLVIFMLVDMGIYQAKVKYLATNYPQSTIIIKNFISNLKRYLLIKTISALATALILLPALLYFKVPYATLWVTLAFVLNYIPTIGSIIAAIPAVMISLLVNDLSSTLWLSAIYLIVNIAIGNFIEPKFLGTKLGISTLVVLLSLLFWGFLLGIGGMFLAVPLTMSIKIAMDESKKHKFISVLLSDKKE